MTTSSNAVRIAALAAAFAFSPAHAHHSYGSFDQCTLVALEGEIDEVQWVNPHIVIYLNTEDVDRYRVEWYSLEQSRRQGIAADALRAGERVTITGHAMRDPSLKVLSLLSEIRRATDGWTWAGPARRTPPDCTTG